MKKLTVLPIALSAMLLFGCTKECICENDSTFVEKTLTARPGPSDGQDTRVEKVDGLSTGDHSVEATAPELTIAWWTHNGGIARNRSYIKFPSLSTIASTSQIVSAKLSLYGGASYASAPQGNSMYPGTPHSNPDNSFYVRRVTSAWEEGTMTYNTQPSTTLENQVAVGASNLRYNYNVEIDVTQLVKDMHTAGNYQGFAMLLQDENIYKNMIFYSSEHSDASKRPQLVVVYKEKQ
jgi:hypothetical protein